MRPLDGMSLLLPWLTDGTGTRLLTERAVLAVPDRRHFRRWVTLREASREHLVPFEPQWPDDELTRAGWRRRLKRYRHDRRHDMGYAYLVMRRSDGALVGGVTLSNVRRGISQSASVGYWTGSSFVRQGYAGEALAAILKHAFEVLELNRIEAACMPVNRASIRVLERAGFRHEGLARSYLRINGRWEDHLLFARLRHDRGVALQRSEVAVMDGSGEAGLGLSASSRQAGAGVETAQASKTGDTPSADGWAA
ncbi:MAG: GNAT family protein [Hyphomicrobiaceae bacterium]|nr:GNAT family protein [Hyphomicrobiaceae bacterium]